LEVIARRHGVASLALVEVASVACLSPSRYSHLFKAEMGISYQAYLNWTRLKTAIRLLLRDELNLTAAALEAGFYDTAHFSRQFKAFLGVNPGAVYDNSRIVQAGAVQDL
jgi:AraC family transcriptional regulator